MRTNHSSKKHKNIVFLVFFLSKNPSTKLQAWILFPRHYQQSCYEQHPSHLRQQGPFFDWLYQPLKECECSRLNTHPSCRLSLRHHEDTQAQSSATEWPPHQPEQTPHVCHEVDDTCARNLPKDLHMPPDSCTLAPNVQNPAASKACHAAPVIWPRMQPWCMDTSCHGPRCQKRSPCSSAACAWQELLKQHLPQCEDFATVSTQDLGWKSGEVFFPSL